MLKLFWGLLSRLWKKSSDNLPPIDNLFTPPAIHLSEQYSPLALQEDVYLPSGRTFAINRDKPDLLDLLALEIESSFEKMGHKIMLRRLIYGDNMQFIVNSASVTIGYVDLVKKEFHVDTGYNTMVTLSAYDPNFFRDSILAVVRRAQYLKDTYGRRLREIRDGYPG